MPNIIEVTVSRFQLPKCSIYRKSYTATPSRLVSLPIVLVRSRTISVIL